MTASQTLVRPAVERDLPAITEIYADAVLNGTATFELEPPGVDEMTRRWRALHDSAFPFLVAVKDGAPAGYAYAGAYRGRPAYRFTVESSVYVDAKARRSGIGRSLLEHLITACESSGFRQMIAIIGNSRHCSSIGLHRAVGFNFAGTLHSVGHKHGRWLDTVFMQRALGPGDETPPDSGT